jgi:hypothetical protein
MSSIAEFIKIREHIEALATKITLLAERKASLEAKQRLDEANKHLDTLKTMVANDVQVIVIERLTRQLTRLGTKVEAMLAKKKPVKKEMKAAV